VGEGGDAELGSGRLADGNGAGPAQTPHVDGVVVDRRAALVEERAVRRRHAAAVFEVLHTERNTGEGARIVAPRHGLVDGLSGGARRVGIEVHEGVEVVVAGGDGMKALVEDLGGLQLSGPDRLCDLNDRAH